MPTVELPEILTESIAAKLPFRPPLMVDAPAAETADSLVMIVDDEPVNIMLVRKYLKGFGYRRIIGCTHAPDALDLMRGVRPNVVLLDVMMPHVDGLEILRAMRADRDLRHVPVILLTAHCDAGMKCAALAAGASEFLAKPVDPNELALRVRNALVSKELNQ